MALALILRNASKLHAGSQQQILKITSVALNRDYSLTSSDKNQILQPKNLSVCQNLVAPHVRFMSGDHSKLWPIEKGLSVALLILTPAAIAAPNFIFDNLWAISSVIHFHWGLEAVVVDYARPIVLGNVLPKIALGLLYLISATTLGGLLYYNVNDIGIGKTIRKFWAIPAGGKEE